MKYLLLSAIAILWACNLTAQNVGIGTAFPATKLHVHGFGDQYLRVHSSSGAITGHNAGLRLTRSSPVVSSDWQILNTGSLTFNFAVDDFTSGDGTEVMRLISTGSLGIGTSSPSRKLHINGSGYQAVRIQSTDDDAAVELLQTGQDWKIVNDNGLLKFLHGNDDFATEGTEHWRITTTGYLSHGTTSTHAPLHIVGGEEVNYIDDGHIMLGPSTSLNLIMDNNEILARNGSSESDLYVQKDGGDLLLCGDEAGAVGIGVGAGNIPNGYLLAVDGKIVVEELRVDLSGSWPDYVFTDAHLLKPLELLEAEIYAAGHLPGMPSAGDIADSGQMVGDVQRRLLEKVEELTLYTIQQQKEINELRLQLVDISNRGQ